MLIYKVLRGPEWADMLAKGETLGAPIDLADGYVHLSTSEQISGTLAKHFAKETDLMLLAIEADDLGDALRWEVSRGNSLFPHLYRSLRASEIAWHKPLTAAEHPSGFAPIWI